ncbi:avidin-like [Mauremys reevesii]|uniref:avidin-like n=1 Tax=Mauremys reevesii TaxID=260615 RepID=UPI00193F6C14|nr:avidin-like [Mauremys reevesii]
MIKKISFTVALGLASLGALSGQKLLCQEDGNVTEGKKRAEEERATKKTKPRPGPTPGQQRRAASSKCFLTGSWRNELGSEMQIQEVNRDGTFSGEYRTAVSLAQRPIQAAPLNGSQHFDAAGQPTFGLTVNWKSFSDSTTVFTGQCFVDENGKEILETMWLLREKAEAHDGWGATRVGKDVFTRINGQNVDESVRSDGAR